MATRLQRTIRLGILALASLGALPAHAQRISLTDLQNQIAASMTCPAALPGQPRFVDKGDGTICDSATGLMWEKKLACAEPANPRCVDNVYSWTNSVPPYAEPLGTLYSEFLEGINDLKHPNDGAATACFAGHCDWRIPSIGELRSILIAAAPGCPAVPCIDPIFGPTVASLYWSSSSSASNSAHAYYVNFLGAGVFVSFNKRDSYFARAVRGGR